MTRTTNARIAGFTFLFYIAVAFPSMVLFGRATSGEGIAATRASLSTRQTCASPACSPCSAASRPWCWP